MEETVSLSRWGHIAYNNWKRIPDHFPFVDLDRFVVMPNHIHGILHILDRGCVDEDPTVGAQHAAPNQTNVNQDSIGAIIRSFKSSVTRSVNVIRKTPSQRFWQRNYYEHIIRNEKEYLQICEYIGLNPQKWSLDRYCRDE